MVHFHIFLLRSVTKQFNVLLIFAPNRAYCSNSHCETNEKTGGMPEAPPPIYI